MAITVGGSPQTVTTAKTQQADPPKGAGQPAAPPATGGPQPPWQARGTAGGRPADPVADKLAQIAELVKGHTDGAKQKQIIDIFKNASPDELNQLITRMPQHDMHEMIDDLDNHHFGPIKFGPQNHTAFLNLLSKDRIGDLSTDSKAKVIATLQYHDTDHGEEGAIRDLIVGTKGKDLTALKNAIDTQGDYHDLQQLVWHDIGDKKIRGQILDQFKKEAVPTGQQKVLSDIDDTFYANWIDKGVPKKTIYPGVRQLYNEIDKGPNSSSPDRQGDLAFLSARPYDRLGISQDLSLDMMHKDAVQDGQVNESMKNATIMSGDLLHLVGNDAIAAKKFDNWKQERQLYPEYTTVFFGDSGQGDAIFGGNAVADKKNGAEMKSVMIHNVTDMDDAGKAEWAKKGVFVFDTYVGAATHAYEQGLISKEGLQRVAGSALKELNGINNWDSDEQKAKQQQLLTRDIAAMQAAIAASGSR